MENQTGNLYKVMLSFSMKNEIKCYAIYAKAQ